MRSNYSNIAILKREVIILAGGFGTRLREIVADLPKCLAPINDKPFLSYLIRYLQGYGVNRFIMSLGYKSDMVISYIQKNHSEINVVFVVEDTPLGTGGAIKAALIEAKLNNVLVVNGDTFFNINLNDFYRIASNHQYSFSIALKRIEKNFRYGFVELNQKSEIIGFYEKKESNHILINTGFYLIDKTKLNFENNEQKFSLEKDFFESATRRDRIYGIEFDSEFIDIGIPEDFIKAQTFFKQLNIN